MITLIKSDGTIVLTQPTRVYQGSSISEVILLGGVAQNLIPEIAFKLPQSGVYTAFDYMTSANIPTGEGISAWSYSIPLAVTQEYGQTDFQIRIKDTNGKVIASGLCSFEVERGVPPDTSEIPDIDPFNTIKEIIESIQGDIENSWFESKGILPYDVAYSYKQNALIYNKDEQGDYRFYCSLTDNNSGNELTDATKWTSVPIMLETDVNGKISAHNTSNTAHQDIRSLISTLTSRVTQNESDIATNTGNIQQNTLAIGNLTTQVETNASLIADTRNNLANNYYTKTQTYTKDEIKSLLGTAAGFQFVIVDELPEQGDPTKIYLVPITQPETRAAVAENSYFEYIWLSAESRYENIGSTQIDLSNYYTKDEITNLLSPIQESISTLETDNTSNKTNISSLQSNKLDKNQGQGNAGKILGIDNDGNIIPQEAPKEIILKYSSFVQPDSFVPNTDLWQPNSESSSVGIGYIDMNVKINFIGLTNGSPTIMYQTATADGNGYLLQAINLGTGTNHDTLQIMSSTNLGGQTINISPDAATINNSNILTENNGLLKNQGVENSGKVLTVGSDGNVAPQAAQGGVNLKYSTFVQNEQMPNTDLWTPSNPSSDSIGIGYFLMSEAGPEKLSITGLQGGLPLMSYADVAGGIQQQIAFGISTNTGTKGIDITANDSSNNLSMVIAPTGVIINNADVLTSDNSENIISNYNEIVGNGGDYFINQILLPTGVEITNPCVIAHQKYYELMFTILIPQSLMATTTGATLSIPKDDVQRINGVNITSAEVLYSNVGTGVCFSIESKTITIMPVTRDKDQKFSVSMKLIKE